VTGGAEAFENDDPIEKTLFSRRWACVRSVPDSQVSWMGIYWSEMLKSFPVRDCEADSTSYHQGPVSSSQAMDGRGHVAISP